MPDEPARLKGAARRCATGLRPAHDPGRPLQKRAAAGARGRYGQQGRRPRKAPASRGHGARHLVDTGLGSTDKQGSRLLRWALIEAVQRIPRDSVTGAIKDAIIARRGKEAKNIAKVAAARRLLTLVYYGLRDGQIRCLAQAPAQPHMPQPPAQAA